MLAEFQMPRSPESPSRPNHNRHGRGRSIGIGSLNVQSEDMPEEISLLDIIKKKSRKKLPPFANFAEVDKEG